MQLPMIICQGGQLCGVTAAYTIVTDSPELELIGSLRASNEQNLQSTTQAFLPHPWKTQSSKV